MKLFGRKTTDRSATNQVQFLRELYEQHAGYLAYLSIDYLHDKKDAEDIVADVFLHVVKNISQIEHYSCSQIASYLVICTRGRCLNLLRKRQKQLEIEESLYDQQGQPLDVESKEDPVDIQVLKKIDLETAAQLLEQIPPSYRDAFKLKYQMGLDDAAIAHAIGIQPQSVKEYIRRAQHALRQLAIERGVAHER